MKKERFEEINKILGNDKDRIEELVALSAEEAAAKLTEEGTPVSAEELKEFSNIIRSATYEEEGELNEEELENVSGGYTHFYVMRGYYGPYGPIYPNATIVVVIVYNKRPW